MKWTETIPGKRWTTTEPPKGDSVVARVERSFTSDKGKHRFYCYRNGDLIAMRYTVEEAQKRCLGDKERERKHDNALLYVDKYSPDVPAFLLLTEQERREVKATYSYAMPAPSKLEAAVKKVGWQDARNLADPSTVKFLAQLGERLAETPGPDGQRGAVARGGKGSARVGGVGPDRAPQAPDSGTGNLLGTAVGGRDTRPVPAMAGGRSTSPAPRSRADYKAKVAELLARGCTAQEVLSATGWTAVSMPAMAKTLGVGLRIDKSAKPFKYYAESKA